MTETHTYTTDATTAARMTKAFVKMQFAQTKLRVVYALMLATVVFDLVLAHTDGLFISFGLIVFMVLLPILTYRNAKRAFGAYAASGSILSTGFGDEFVKIDTPKGNSEIKFSAFQDLKVRDGFVMLRHQGSGIHTVLPQELFPDEAIARIRQSLAPKK